MNAMKSGAYPITLNGEEYGLLFSLNALDEMQERFGGYDKLHEVFNQNNKDWVKDTRWLFTLLINEARLAENEYIGMSSGIMDPFAIAMGKKDHAILLDTSDLSYEYAPLELPHQKIIVTNSQKARLAVDERYQERQAQCQEALHDLQTVIAIQNLSELTADVFEQVQEMIRRPVCLRRARHAVTENQRTIQAVEALNKGDIREFGQLMNASHLSLKEDFEVSCEELDILVEEAWEIEGVLGSRMMGAGFGGCTISIVENDAVNEFVSRVGSHYKERTGRTAEFYIMETGNGASDV
mgnify:CR=1 FL=1